MLNFNYNESGYTNDAASKPTLDEQYFKVKEVIEYTLRWLSSIDCKIIFIFSINVFYFTENNW